MTDATFDRIRAEIARAGRFAKAGQHELAAQSFAVVRAMIVECVEPALLRQAVAALRPARRAAREAFRKAVLGRGATGKPLLVLTDTAALPAAGGEATFAWLLGDAPHFFRVDCIGQEAFTSADILTVLNNAPKLGAGADVVINIGWHDSAPDVLQPHELAANGLLPADLGTMLRDFLATHQVLLAAHLPVRHIVPVDLFRANLDAILRALQARAARRIVVCTILSVAGRVLHNAAILEAARHANVQIIDLDRIARHLAAEVTDDGHWSNTLHAVFAATVAAHLTPRVTRPSRDAAVPATIAQEVAPQ